jgi:hypothetical protein
MDWRVFYIRVRDGEDVSPLSHVLDDRLAEL